MEHTATPWKRMHPANQNIEANGLQVAGVYCQRKNWNDNAEFIVHAVNAHDELVEALRAVRESLKGDINYSGLCILAHKALAKAEGKN